MPGAHRRRRLSWARLALWAEAASLALWMASSPSVDVRAGVLLAMGLALSAATVGALAGPPARRDLLSWALLLHRCRLPYALPPREDTLVANSSLPAPARLDWVLLFKSGVFNAGAVSLAVQRRAPWVFAQQVVSALLLAKRVVSLCDVASRSDLAAAMEAATLAFTRWGPPIPSALVAVPEDLAGQFCHAAGLTLIFTWVVAAALAAAFARRDFPNHMPDEKHPPTAATAASAAGPGSASTSGSRELAGGGASGRLRRRREAWEELAAEGGGGGDPPEVLGAVGPSRAAVAAGVAALALAVGMAAWDLGTLMSASWGKDGWHWTGAGGGV